MTFKQDFVNMILADDDVERERIYDSIAGVTHPRNIIAISKNKIKSVKKIRKAEDEYVYDIGMRNVSKPWYFGNNILIHNSCYFTAYPILKEQIDKGEVEWTKEMCIELYDNIADQTNASFPAFMEKAFHCPIKSGEIIKAGRELIGERSIFITKKRYAINIFDKEGKRKDVNGKNGEIKAMGLDLKRADTPKYVQEFLMEILVMVLGGKQRDEVIEKIKEFKNHLSEQDSWTKGSPKSVNNLTNHTIKFEKTGVCSVGHARAAINYNYLRKMNSDNYSQKIVDGMKVIVCKLRTNALGFTSIAYPTDELRLPQWFLDLPFDDKDMERILVDEKIDNLLSVLNWDIRSNTDTNSTFDDLFSFS